MRNDFDGLPQADVVDTDGLTHLRDAVRTLEDRLAKSRIEELGGVGHVGILSAPDRVATAVRPFLQETATRV